MFRKKRSTIYTIEIEGIEVEVTRKSIKNLYVRVNRRNGKVRVSCPLRISEKHLTRFIASKLSWIKKQKEKTTLIKPERALQYLSGEKHLFMGKEYFLVVKKGDSKSNVFLEKDSLIMQIRGKDTLEKRTKLLDEWYRAHLKEMIQELIRKYEPIMDVKVLEFGVKKMKTRWGTCNIKDQRIWLNLELAKKSFDCLEMVVVHEMVHLLERLHNKRFYFLMDKFMPEWRKANTKLNSFID
ncbi:MAG: M48 family metallopeptidase [Balneolaceae bacterium]|nr:M48 family metallopeptidase [Balneolaceae bacterium]MBO6547196.1 M48 family metallopeptidase [Balneolaceae bacterium]MBO6647857.1 M48 family metallopeptidase [Balneolaceae bacterium]